MAAYREGLIAGPELEKTIKRKQISKNCLTIFYALCVVPASLV